MMSMKMAKLSFAMIVVAACFPVQPSSAGNFAYLSATGSGSACTAASPCGNFIDAFASVLSGGRILCLDAVAVSQSLALSPPGSVTFDIDCPAGSWAGDGSLSPILTVDANLTLTFRNMTFDGVGSANNAIRVIAAGSGTLIFENCVFANSLRSALDIQTGGALNLVIKDSRISNNGTPAVLLKPAAGGSIKATLDRVTITSNNGDGIQADSTLGVIDLDVTDSEITNNAGNGIVAIAGGSTQDIVSVKSGVMVRNGLAGIEVDGVAAGVLVANTLFDQNTAGATSVVSGGNIFTFGNNQIVGSMGSGFTGTWPLR